MKYLKRKMGEMIIRLGSTEPHNWMQQEVKIKVKCCRIIKRPDGRDWELGSGAYGRVVKGLRAGVQVAWQDS